MIPTEKMMCVRDVAGALGVGRDSVVRLLRRGHLRGVTLPKMGGYGSNVTYRIPESEVRLFLKRNML